MDDIAPGAGRLMHAPATHPRVKAAKVGILLANLGTPDATDYWSMRRYLNEFLSDKRVVDVPDWNMAAEPATDHVVDPPAAVRCELQTDLEQ